MAKTQRKTTKNTTLSNSKPEAPKEKPIRKKKPGKVAKNQQKINQDDNKISIKKLANEKQIIADFPYIVGPNNVKVMSIPIFRMDNNTSTPGFSLPDEFTDDFRKEQEVLQEYRVNAETSTIPVERIKEPKPSARNSYCTICKIRFDDYKQHIKDGEHLKKMRDSQYNQDIHNLCMKMQGLQNFQQNHQDHKIDLEETGNIIDEETPQTPFEKRLTTDVCTERKQSLDDRKQKLYEQFLKDSMDLKQEVQVVHSQLNNQSSIFNVLA